MLLGPDQPESMGLSIYLDLIDTSQGREFELVYSVVFKTLVLYARILLIRFL